MDFLFQQNLRDLIRQGGNLNKSQILWAIQHDVVKFSGVGLIKVQKYRCFYCNYTMSPEDRTRDHFLPKSHGYSIVHNIVFCCAECNRSKWKRLLENNTFKGKKWSKLFKRSKTKNIIECINGLMATYPYL